MGAFVLAPDGRRKLADDSILHARVSEAEQACDAAKRDQRPSEGGELSRHRWRPSVENVRHSPIAAQESGCSKHLWRGCHGERDAAPKRGPQMCPCAWTSRARKRWACETPRRAYPSTLRHEWSARRMPRGTSDWRCRQGGPVVHACVRAEEGPSDGITVLWNPVGWRVSRCRVDRAPSKRERGGRR